jgi:bacterioferritin
MSTNHTPMDIEAIRERASRNLDHGAVTESYRGDRKQVIELLNNALATEIVCVLRYKRHAWMARGFRAEACIAEFLEHADQEQEHADQIAERIVQLEGDPDLDPRGLAERSHSLYSRGGTLEEMLRENLIAERVAIEMYTEMIRRIGDDDPTTRRLLEEILAVEEEHANDLVGLWADEKDNGRAHDRLV